MLGIQDYSADKYGKLPLVQSTERTGEPPSHSRLLLRVNPPLTDLNAPQASFAPSLSTSPRLTSAKT